MNELPNDLQSERNIIAGMCRCETIFYNAVSKLQNHFYSDSHQCIFEELKKHEKPDLVALDHICKKINSEIFYSIVDAYGSFDGNTEIGYIIDAYKRRRIILSAQEAIHAAYSNGDMSPDNISSQLMSDLNEIELSDDMQHIKNLIPCEIKRIESVSKSGTAAFIKTGIPAIDEKLIITQSDYMILGGRPSNGKSALSGSIARNVAKQGRRVLFFCLDTRKEVEVSRAIFSEAGCDLHSFNRGMMSKTDYFKINDACSTLSDCELYMSSNDVTAEQIVAKSRRLQSEVGKIDLVIIDYLTRIRCNKYRTIRENTNHISRELHELPKIINCPVLALSQLNRYENEEYVPPSRKNLKESGNLEQDADILLFVHWPGNYPTFSSSKAGFGSEYFRLYVSKQKNGPVGLIELSIDKTTLNFSKYERVKTKSADGWQDEY